MKNLKEHKVQILAALALAFSLGMVMPNAVFASGETEGEPVAQAADAVQAATSTDLYNAIEEAKKAEGYNDYYALYNAQQDLAKDLTAATEAQVTAAKQAVVKINSDAQVGDMNATQLNTYILAMSGYGDWAKMFDALKVVNEKTNNATLTAQVIGANMTPAEIQTAYNAFDAFNNRVTGTLAENILKLVDRINTRDSFKGYRDSVAFVSGVMMLAEPGNATETQLTAAVAAVKAELKTWKPAVEGVDTMTNAQLVETAKTMPNYDKYAALYDAMGFIRALAKEDGTVTVQDISKVEQSAQMTGYSKIATAANAIDNTVMKGLMGGYELPDTSAPTEDKKPNVPDTGIVGLIEPGALDMATITLIVSVALASVAGIALIAKLYLKHKF